MKFVDIKAYGKVNLGLQITGVRQGDGYHTLRMVMQSVDLADQVHVELMLEREIRLAVSGSREVPADSRNLAWKAARRMLELAGSSQGVSIRIDKHIPVAGGMAGGSTDAAAVLLAMQRLLGVADRDILFREALALGADVPFCLVGGTVLAEGIGEVLTPLSPMPSCYMIIAAMDAAVSTPAMYREWDSWRRPFAGEPDTEGILRAVREGDFDLLISSMGNSLEQVTRSHVPGVAEAEALLEALGANRAMMSGSGPTVFALFRQRNARDEAYVRMTGALSADRREAALAEKMRQAGILRVYKTSPVIPGTPAAGRAGYTHGFRSDGYMQQNAEESDD